MATDIQAAISGLPVKNGSAIVTTTFTGQHSSLDTSVQNKPTIIDIENKYDNKFYNGIFVQVIGSGAIG
jgi:hypothetical protein